MHGLEWNIVKISIIILGLGGLLVVYGIIMRRVKPTRTNLFYIPAGLILIIIGVVIIEGIYIFSVYDTCYECFSLENQQTLVGKIFCVISGYTIDTTSAVNIVIFSIYSIIVPIIFLTYLIYVSAEEVIENKHARKVMAFCIAMIGYRSVPWIIQGVSAAIAAVSMVFANFFLLELALRRVYKLWKVSESLKPIYTTELGPKRIDRIKNLIIKYVEMNLIEDCIRGLEDLKEEMPRSKKKIQKLINELKELQNREGKLGKKDVEKIKNFLEKLR